MASLYFVARLKFQYNTAVVMQGFEFW